MKKILQAVFDLLLKIIVYSYLTIIGSIAFAMCLIYFRLKKTLKFFTSHSKEEKTKFNKPAGA